MSGDKDKPHHPSFSTSEVELHYSTPAREFTMVNALMHFPQEKCGIQLVAVRVGKHPLDCPCAQILDHVRQIPSRFGEDVLRVVGLHARVPFDDPVMLEMPETGNEERSRNVG